ncbi:hypothetical protein OIY81_748 [Cryptosporidium canis]|uniref:Uncharacterized protein n=1 Tax=Cryptosporidium canis TaxID=195482 RepID=A0ABQ8PE64_9CRYT|nr:hypothetical protein OIY81_748 [Cryptosporidium canis]KAJ1615269.1 hypothetical protein OJ252_291 [Cryptosporidium canis]
MDTRLFTRFPSTYHLRTLFDEYQYLNESENSEGSEVGDALDTDNRYSDTLIEDNDGRSKHGINDGISIGASRIATENDEIDVMNINSNRSSLNSNSVCSTNRSKQSKKNKRRSYKR